MNNLTHADDVLFIDAGFAKALFAKCVATDY
jgi:hypothetical protein